MTISEDIGLNTIQKDQLIDAIGEQYQKAVNICKNLLNEMGLLERLVFTHTCWWTNLFT